MARAWSPLPKVHEVWARAPLALRLSRVQTAEHEVRAQAPREPLSVLLAHEVEAQAPLAQEHEAEAHEAEARAPLAQEHEAEARAPLALEHEAEARAPLAQAHEAEAQALLAQTPSRQQAQALLAQAPSRQQAHPRVKVPLEVLLAQAPCWAAVPLAIHRAHVQRL